MAKADHFKLLDAGFKQGAAWRNLIHRDFKTILSYSAGEPGFVHWHREGISGKRKPFVKGV